MIRAYFEDEKRVTIVKLRVDQRDGNSCSSSMSIEERIFLRLRISEKQDFHKEDICCKNEIVSKIDRYMLNVQLTVY